MSAPREFFKDDYVHPATMRLIRAGVRLVGLLLITAGICAAMLGVL